MRPLATGNAFFTSSGSSPPDDDARVSDQEAGPIEGHPLPPQLIKDLAALLASALVADIRQHPNLAPVQANQDSTVESPRGHDRSQGSPAPVASGASRHRGTRICPAEKRPRQGATERNSNDSTSGPPPPGTPRFLGGVASVESLSAAVPILAPGKERR
jgi:hypothetical protein